MLDIESPLVLSIFVLFALAFLVQLAYYLFVFSRLGFHKETNNDKIHQEPVSIIICARNELENLRKNLEGTLQQEYPIYEVIVVNDCSYDESGEFLKEMAARYDRLKVVNIVEQEKYQHGKKFALTLGIKAAKYDLLLLTDADCAVNSKDWISIMQNSFGKDKDIVLGYGPYQKRNTFVNRLIRFDSFYAALQYLSFSLVHRTYMGVGRNLAYRKSIFFKNKGFASHYHLMSGDDDLFINEVATETNTVIQIHPHSFTYSTPKETFKTWFRQKKRHITTSKFYKTKDKWLLGGLAASHILFYLSLTALFILHFDWVTLVSIVGARVLIQHIILGKAMHKLKELDLLPYLLLLDFFIVFFYPILAVSNAFTPVKRWK